MGASIDLEEFFEDGDRKLVDPFQSALRSVGVNRLEDLRLLDGSRRSLAGAAARRVAPVVPLSATPARKPLSFRAVPVAVAAACGPVRPYSAGGKILVQGSFSGGTAAALQFPKSC